VSDDGLDFLVAIGKKAPSITLSQLRVLLEIVLPQRRYDVDTAIELVKWIQTKNNSAYLSHRKRRINTSGKSP